VWPRSTTQASPSLGFATLGFQIIEYQEPLVGATIVVRQNLLVVLDFKDEARNLAPLALAELGQLVA
jgi:hypothetical protein